MLRLESHLFNTVLPRDRTLDFVHHLQSWLVSGFTQIILTVVLGHLSFISLEPLIKAGFTVVTQIWMVTWSTLWLFDLHNFTFNKPLYQNNSDWWMRLSSGPPPLALQWLMRPVDLESGSGVHASFSRVKQCSLNTLERLFFPLQRQTGGASEDFGVGC